MYLYIVSIYKKSSNLVKILLLCTYILDKKNSQITQENDTSLHSATTWTIFLFQNCSSLLIIINEQAKERRPLCLQHSADRSDPDCVEHTIIFAGSMWPWWLHMVIWVVFINVRCTPSHYELLVFSILKGKTKYKINRYYYITIFWKCPFFSEYIYNYKFCGQSQRG